jgi:hypothetical protein
MIGRVLLARKLDGRLRVHDYMVYPIVRGDSFRRVGVIGEIPMNLTLLRGLQCLAIRWKRHQPWPRAAPPLASFYAPLALGFEFGEKGSALFSLAQRRLWLCRH